MRCGREGKEAEGRLEGKGLGNQGMGEIGEDGLEMKLGSTRVLLTTAGQTRKMAATVGMGMNSTKRV